MDDVRERLQRASRYVTLPDRPFDRLVDRRDRRRRGQRLTAAALALGVAVTAVGGGLAVLSGLEKQPSAAVGGLSLRPGEYFYLRIQSSEAVDGHIRDLETWWATDDSGEVRNRSTRQDKYPTPPSGTFGPGEFPIDIAASDDLSSEPEALAAQLHDDLWGAGQGAEQPEELWDVISYLLLEAPNLPADVRAALFEVAKGVPGVTTTEDTEDRLGRGAVALEFSIDGGSWTMYFDPRTHQMITWSFSYKGGRVSWIVLESGIVASPGERPHGDGWLVSPLPPDLDP